MKEYDIFDLPNAENCGCKIIDYTDRHSLLSIQLINPIPDSPKLFIVFAAIYYLEAPISWKGANFELASSDESAVLWRKIYPLESDKRIEQLAKVYKAFIIKTSVTNVKILAMGQHITEKDLLTPKFD